MNTNAELKSCDSGGGYVTATNVKIFPLPNDDEILLNEIPEERISGHNTEAEYEVSVDYQHEQVNKQVKLEVRSLNSILKFITTNEADANVKVT